MEGIHHIGLVVKDIEKSIRFYQYHFGFQLKKRWINPRNGAQIALIGKGGLTYELIEYLKNPYEGQGAYNHVAILTEDVEKEMEELKRKGVSVEEGSSRLIMEGQGKIIFCYGPDGEMIELHERIGEKGEGE